MNKTLNKEMSLKLSASVDGKNTKMNLQIVIRNI